MQRFAKFELYGYNECNDHNNVDWVVDDIMQCAGNLDGEVAVCQVNGKKTNCTQRERERDRESFVLILNVLLASQKWYST